MDKLILKLTERKTSVFRLVLLIFLTMCISGSIISRYSVIETQNPIIDNTSWICEKNIKDQTVIYSRKVTKDVLNKSILFYTENAFIDISIGNENKYHFGSNTNVAKTPGSNWTFYHISDESKINQDLKIQVKYVYHIPDEEPIIYIGDSTTLSLSRIKIELPNILLNITIFNISILFIVCYIQNKENKHDKKNSKKFLCYGSLGFLLLFMSSCLLFSTQLIFPSGLGQYYLYYLSFFTIPLTVLLYIGEYTKDNLNTEFLLHLLFVSFMVFLQIFHIFDFVELAPFYCICTFIKFVIIICKIYKISNTKRKPPFIFTIVWFLFFCMLSYCVQNVLPTHKIKFMLIVKIGFLLYTIPELFFYVKKKTEDSKHMYYNAYIDTMTGIGNRNLLYKEINKYKLEEMCVTFLDINNLKHCNDTYGHDYGDILIENAAKLICEVYGEEHVYRIGGDEFVVLQYNLSEETLIRLRNTLFKKIKEYNSTTTIDNKPYLEIACGFSSYKNGDEKYTDIIERADKIMYENKIYVKSIHTKIRK